MITFSNIKTGTVTLATASTSWVSVTLYDNAGTAVDPVIGVPADFMDLVGGTGGDCVVRINGSLGAAYFVPAGSSRRVTGYERVKTVEIIRHASSDVAGFHCSGERAV